MPEELELEISTPKLTGLSSDQAQVHIDKLVSEREMAVRDRVLRQGRRFMGRRAVINQKPAAAPRTIEPRRTLSPRVASQNRWLRIEALGRCADFTRAYRDALRAWCASKRDVIFPFGTYAMKRRHAALCADA